MPQYVNICMTRSSHNKAGSPKTFDWTSRKPFLRLDEVGRWIWSVSISTTLVGDTSSYSFFRLELWLAASELTLRAADKFKWLSLLGGLQMIEVFATEAEDQLKRRQTSIQLEGSYTASTLLSHWFAVYDSTHSHLLCALCDTVHGICRDIRSAWKSKSVLEG